MMGGGGLPPQHAQAMQQALAAMASGQNAQLLADVSAKMGLSPDELRQAAGAVVSGQGPTGMPPEVVQRAMKMQQQMKQQMHQQHQEEEALFGHGSAVDGSSGAMLPPGGEAAGAPAAVTTTASSGLADEASSGWSVLVDEERAQGCVELYRRAYGRHLDVAYPPLYVAAASGALASGLLPLWLALLLLPAGFVLGTYLLLIKGERGSGRGRACSC